MACPYNVRHKDPVSGTASLKCSLCIDRTGEGMEPSCVKVCPTGALAFGDKDYIVTKARDRAAKIGGYVYGDETTGIGTQVIYVSDIPFEEYGFFPTKDKRVYPPDRVQSQSLPLGGVAIAGLAGMAAIGLLVRRKKEVSESDKNRGDD